MVGTFLLCVLRFIVQDGGCIKFWEGDLDVVCKNVRMMESQADSCVDKILTAVNMEGRLYTRNQLSNWSINGPSLP